MRPSKPTTRPTPTATPTATPLPQPQTLRGVSLSPRSFAGPDFTDFFQKAKAAGGAVSWSGDWSELGNTAGGGPTGYADQVRSIMERLMALPPGTRLHPGHREPTTVGAEWEGNPFIRVWRGLDPEGAEPCRVSGEDATLVTQACGAAMPSSGA